VSRPRSRRTSGACCSGWSACWQRWPRLNQLAVELNTRTNRLKPVLAYCEEQDWVEAEVGPNRAHLHTITKLGKSYLRDLGKRS
jgi:hypothetical protein